MVLLVVMFPVYFVLLRMTSMAYWEIWIANIEAGSVVNIAITHLSRPKIVHPFGASTFGISIVGIRHVDSRGVVLPFSVVPTEVCEHSTNTGLLCVKVICDTAIIRDVGAVWIAGEIIVIIFIFKNLFCIQDVKRSENKSVICLARLFVSQ